MLAEVRRRTGALGGEVTNCYTRRGRAPRKHGTLRRTQTHTCTRVAHVDKTDAIPRRPLSEAVQEPREAAQEPSEARCLSNEAGLHQAIG